MFYHKYLVMCLVLYRAQEVFKQALLSGELRLGVIKNTPPPLPKQPPPLPRGPPPVRPKLELPPRTSTSSTSSLSPTATQVSSLPGHQMGNGSVVHLEGRTMSDASSPNTSTPLAVSKMPVIRATSLDGAPDSPSKKTPPAVPARHPTTHITSQPKARLVAPTNTRRIGKKINIDMVKGNTHPLQTFNVVHVFGQHHRHILVYFL